jgi:hypothetical protein
MIVMEILPPLKLNPKAPQKFCRVCASTFTTFSQSLKQIPFVGAPTRDRSNTDCYNHNLLPSSPTIILLPIWMLGTGFSILHQAPLLEREIIQKYGNAVINQTKIIFIPVD